MNPDQRHQASGHPFALSNDLRSLDHPLHPTVNPAPLPAPMAHRATGPRNPSYNMRPPGPSYLPKVPLSPTIPDDTPGPWTRRSASWSRAEDERLAHLVRLEEANAPSNNTPTKMWSRVAAQLTGRTGKQCRERWLNQLKPGIRRGSWTDEEERILHTAHAELGNKWVAIAQRLPGRTDNCVKNHWNSMLRKRQRREAALRSSYAAATRAVPSRMPGGSMPGGSLPGGTMLGPVNPHLARRASSMAEEKKIGNPSAAYYETMHNQNPAMYESMARSLMELPGLTSPITPQRNAKLQIANLVVPAKTGSTYDHQHHVSARVGEKRPAPPLNYDSVSKRRSVLYPSAQMNLGARRAPMNRTLNPPTFNNYPDLGRPAHHGENIPQLQQLVPFAKQDVAYPKYDDTMPAYSYSPHLTAISPRVDPRWPESPSAVPPRWTSVCGSPSTYGAPEQKMTQPKLAAVEVSDLTKSLDPALGAGAGDASVKRAQSESEFVPGKSEMMKNGSKTPGGPGKQLHFSPSSQAACRLRHSRPSRASARPASAARRRQRPAALGPALLPRRVMGWA